MTKPITESSWFWLLITILGIALLVWLERLQ